MATIRSDNSARVNSLCWIRTPPSSRTDTLSEKYVDDQDHHEEESKEQPTWGSEYFGQEAVAGSSY